MPEQPMGLWQRIKRFLLAVTLSDAEVTPPAAPAPLVVHDRSMPYVPVHRPPEPPEVAARLDDAADADFTLYKAERPKRKVPAKLAAIAVKRKPVVKPRKRGH